MSWTVVRPLLLMGAPLVLLACSDDSETWTGGGGASSSSSGTGGSSTSGSGGAIPPPTCAESAAPVGWFAAPDGTAEGDGSPENPWDIVTAIYDPPEVEPGDTVWLRGGTYPGTFVIKQDGTAEAPITVRSYPGEWAVLDSQGATEVVLQLYRTFTIVRDLEITNSDPDRFGEKRATGLYVEGEGHKLVNLVVHDVGSGIIVNSGTPTEAELAPHLELYGTIFYNNGWLDTDRAHGHHIYVQNYEDEKTIADNVLFNAFGSGFHIYSDTDSRYVEGFELTGNIFFQNGAGAPDISKLYDNCLVGHNGSFPVKRLALTENYGWAAGPGERDVRLGWAAPNEDVVVQDNYFVGQTIFQPSWTSVTMTGNTLYGEVEGIDPAAYPDNHYLEAAPTDNHVVVRPNAYQPLRGHVVVYNWEDLDEVAVDLSGVIDPGTVFEVRHVMDLSAEPVASGSYDGGLVTLPMTDLPVAQPVGEPTAIDPSETPGKAFATFLVTGCAP
jgi:hypothetical protein